MTQVNIKKTFGLMTAAAVVLSAAACAKEATLPGASREDPDDTGNEFTAEDAGTTSTREDPTTTDEARNFLVPDGEGDVQVTQVYSGDTHVVGDAQATLRATSDEIDVYVDDPFWGAQVTGAQLNTFMHRLVDQGSALGYRPDLGVLATNEAVFGALHRENLPNGKQRVFVVNTSGAGDGYLCGWCDYPDLHLDGTLVAPLDGEAASSISAHELFHAIHRGYDADEEVWLDETLAEAAMSVNGLFTDDEWLDSYLTSPNIAWGPHGADVASVHYGACLAWGTYLWEQGGPELMRAVTAEPLNGWAGLDAALARVGETRSAWDLYLAMGAALYYDEPERGLGFTSFDLSRAIPTRKLTSSGAQTLTLQPYGLVHLVSDSGSLRVDTATVEDVFVGFVAENTSLSLQVLQPNQAVNVPAGLVVVAAKAAASVSVSLN